jgi:hypothetical protein
MIVYVSENKKIISVGENTKKENWGIITDFIYPAGVIVANYLWRQ